MKQTTISEKSMTIFSLGLLVLAIAIFSWMWFGYSKPSSDSFQTSENLSPVSVAGLDTKVKKLLEGLKNNSGIPIPEPTSKEGRADPFAAL